MAEYLSPGVYVQEFASSPKLTEGVETGTAGFIGAAEKGPVGGIPFAIKNYSEFERTFGGYLSANEFGNFRFLPYAVAHFFMNGGESCYVTRVVPADAVCAAGAVPATDTPVLSFQAKNPGLWGNNLKVIISPLGKAISVKVCYEGEIEEYDNLSFDTGEPNFVEKVMAKSKLLTVTCTASSSEVIKSPFEQLGQSGETEISINFSGGSNGNVRGMTAADFVGVDDGAGKRTGIQSFLDNQIVSIMAVPGVTDPDVQLSLVEHCEKLTSRFAVLDIPRDARTVADIKNHRNIFDSAFAALYHPWLTVFDPLDRKNIQIPPSGSVAGIYARSDNTRGVHKAPANEMVKACDGLDVQFNQEEQDILSPSGVNLIRSFPGMGIRVWGARTVSSNGTWKYVNTRRLIIFIMESIRANISWVMFEPYDETLCIRVRSTIEEFLTQLWRDGALAGTSANEAFFVDVGATTMTQDDIDNGRLICQIGIALVKPAEFVIFRITQKMGEPQ